MGDSEDSSKGSTTTSLRNAWGNVLALFILLLIGVLAFSIRLFSVIKYESVIHEFDPYFNYRVTQYLTKNGIYDFWNWFDDRTWYPLGRVIGGTVFPGLTLTAGSIWRIVNSLNIPLSVETVCVFTAPIFSANAAWATYLLTKEVKGVGAGLTAAALLGMVPSYISRSVAGSYDNEAVAIFALIFTFYLYVKTLNTGSLFYATLNALAYFYMVCSWGGYTFIINLIPMHVLLCIVTGRYSSRLYIAYAPLVVLGTLLAALVPVVGFNAVMTSEHFASFLVFIIINVVALVHYIKGILSPKMFKVAMTLVVTFGINFCIRRDFISNPSSLRKRLMAVGFGMLLISPFLVIFMLVYLFLRHAEQFYNHPSTASSRRWSNLSKWVFREFNEVDHLFRHRISCSVVHSADYLKQFPSPIVTLIAKFISFVAGGFAAILIIIAFLEESLLEGHIFGRNLLWYAAVFGTVTAISRAAVTDEFQVLNPEGAMSLVVQHTHYMPKRWRGKENTDKVRSEFETLFQYTGMMLLEEMASIFLTPYLLLFVVPKRVNDILQFISDFTVDVEGVGDVCSLSAFDFESHGNSNYGSPYNTTQQRRSSQGKMEKSFLSFQSSYLTWEPNAQGKQFLSSLRDFREMHMPHYEAQQTYSPNRIWQLTPRGHGDIQGFASRGGMHNRGGIPRTGCQLDSLWLINEEQKNPPYLLDWYYTSRPSNAAANSEGIRTVPSEVAPEPTEDYWMLHHDGAVVKPPTYEESWGFPLEEDDRVRSHLEASTSNPFFRDSVLQKRDPGHSDRPSESHWWARSGPQLTGQQASFLEPPHFGHQNSNQPYDSHSDRSAEEHVGDIDWSNPRVFSSKLLTDDCERDDTSFNLPFLEPLPFGHQNLNQPHSIFGGPLKSLNTRTDNVDDDQ